MFYETLAHATGCCHGGMSAQRWAVGARRQLKRGEMLFRAGAKFESLFAVRTGFFKTRVTATDGRDQVTGFQMAGELLGLDGIGNDAHTCDAVALEDSQVCQIPYARLEEISRGLGYPHNVTAAPC